MSIGKVSVTLLLSAIGGIAGAQQEVVEMPAPAPAEVSETPAAESATVIAVEPSAEAVPDGADLAVRQPEQAQQQNSLIEEIVVTAQKRSESINDVPISISAFSGEALNTLGVTDTRDLGNLVPGFTAADSGYNTPVYTLRGVGFADSTYTATSTVGVYVDEVNLPYAIMTKGASLDLERVEVLKGPQGILYGRNTTGGAINYIAKKPTDSFQTGLTGSYGRFNTSDVEGYVSGPLTDTLRGRLAIKDIRSQDGSQYSKTRPDDELGRLKKQSFRGALDWDAADDISFRLVAEGWSDRSEPRAPQLLFKVEQNPLDPVGIFLPPQVRGYEPIPQGTDDMRIADWPENFDWQLDDNFLLGALRGDWALSDTMNFVGLLSHMRVASNGSTLPQSGYSFNNAEQQIDAHIETTALELRLSGIAGANDEFDWMVGGNASKDRGNENHIQFVDHQSALFSDPVLGRSLSDLVFVQGSSQVEQLAAFVNVGWKFAEDFKLTSGARYTQQDQKYSGCSGVHEDSQDLGSSVGVLPPGIVGFGQLFPAISAVSAAQYLLKTGRPGVIELSYTNGECFSVADNGSFDKFHGKLKEDNVSFRVALDWQPTDDYLLYGSVGRGYKAGGFPVTQAANQSQFTPVVQEELLAFEVGAKTSLLDRQAHTNLALYYYDYKDKQLLTKAADPLFGPLPVLRNAPKSRVIGAEFDGQYSPKQLSGLFLSATAAYTYTEVREFRSLDADGEDFDFAGRPFNYAPKFQATLLANYRSSLNEHLDLSTGADYYYSSATNSTLDGNPRYKHDSYALLGAQFGVVSVDDRWSVKLFGRNLTNEFYTVAVYRNGDGISRITGLGRTYGLTAEYRFE